jgi:hypothetical protein
MVEAVVDSVAHLIEAVARSAWRKKRLMIIDFIVQF